MISTERARELLDAATPRPWRDNRYDLDHLPAEWRMLPTQNLPLVLAAPDLAETVIAQAGQIDYTRTLINELRDRYALLAADADMLLAALGDES